MKQPLAHTAIKTEASTPTVSCPVRGSGVNREDCWNCGYRLAGASCDVAEPQSPNVYRDAARSMGIM